MLEKMSRLVAILATLAIIAAACGDSTDDTTTGATGDTTTDTPADNTSAADSGDDGVLPMVDPLDVSGDISVAGSSTVFPLAEAMAGRFENEGYSGQITIDSIGSGAGFERFCVEGESDISNASRPIKDSEVESCRGIDRDPIEIRLGTDALAVAVSPGNTFAIDITVEELAVLFSTAGPWQDVRPDWPANPVARFIPGTDSGTFDYFVEAVFDEDEAPILGAGETQKSEDDNVLVQGITADGCDPSDQTTTCAVGFFGYAYYAENSDQLNVLAVEGVEATADAVDAGEYPLARPLYMYTTASIIAEKPQVGEFLNFVLTYVNEEIIEVGYFPAPAADLDMARSALAEALSG